MLASNASVWYRQNYDFFIKTAYGPRGTGVNSYINGSINKSTFNP